MDSLKKGMVVGVMAMEDVPRQLVQVGDTRVVRIEKINNPWSLVCQLLSDDRRVIDICYVFHEREQWWFARQGENQFRVAISLMDIEPKEGE